ncbi:MAG: class I SAM-dependent methyltransferase [Gemmatimonadales bacterium]
MFQRLLFEWFYRFGTPPWEGHPLPKRLRELTEGREALPPGTALDIGCGTGDTAIYLAQHGWTVTAVDFAPTALKRAKAKVAQAGVPVRVVRADVTRLGASGIGGDYGFIIDNGLFHGLSDRAREAYVGGVTEASAPGATLLLAGFAEGPRRGPRGFDRPEVEQRFGPSWELLRSWEDPDMSSRPHDSIYVYQLRRR